MELSEEIHFFFSSFWAMVGQDKGVNYNLETRFLLIIRDLRIECQNTN